MSEQITDVEIAGWVAKSLGYNVVEKREVSQDERQALAEKGKAMPDGSFPIANKEDLANAIQSAGRAKDQDAVHAHIIEQAKALGAEDMIPEQWIKKSAEVEVEPEPEVEVESDEVEKSMNSLDPSHPLFVPNGVSARNDNGLDESHPLHAKF